MQRVCATFLLLSLALAACGGDDEKAEPKAPKRSVVAIDQTGTPKAPAFSVEGDVPAGETEISLTNNGKEPIDGQLVRVDGDHDTAEILTQLKAAVSGKPIEDWFQARGGPGTTPPGATKTVVQVLEPGTYYVLGGDGAPKGEPAHFAVTGAASDAELTAPESGTITAKEYSFDAEPVKTGATTIQFENAGNQWHHMIGFKLNDGATLDDVKAFFQSDGKGKPPFAGENPEIGTTVLDPGQSQTVDVDVAAGTYALVCFLSDRTGGPPHVARGMISELEVQ